MGDGIWPNLAKNPCTHVMPSFLIWEVTENGNRGHSDHLPNLEVTTRAHTEPKLGKTVNVNLGCEFTVGRRCEITAHRAFTLSFKRHPFHTHSTVCARVCRP